MNQETFDQIIVENDVSRENLFRLVKNLSEDDLAVGGKYGWTIAMTLVHLAFWDRFTEARIGMFENHGYEKYTASSAPLNDALRPLLESVPARNATAMVIEAAQAVDAKAARVSLHLAGELENAGQVYFIDRAKHRNEHLAEIATALHMT